MNPPPLILSLSKDEESIIAQCTPIGPGAIALLRISGINAFDIANKISLLSSGDQLSTMASHTIAHGHVIDNKGNIIDEVLFLAMRSPRTFTGQDVVEITAHNNPLIIEHIIAQAIMHGARLAEPGEFTKRAVLNKKSISSRQKQLAI